MGVDASKSLETPRPVPHPTEIGDPDVLIITHNHIGHLTRTGHEQGDLAFDLTGNGGNLAGQFMRDDLVGRDSATVQFLKSLLLTGLQSTDFAEYFTDKLYL